MLVLQAAFRRISNDVFGHLLELDLTFHVHRKTGQIMRILDRGTSSIQVCVTRPPAAGRDLMLAPPLRVGTCCLVAPTALIRAHSMLAVVFGTV